MSAMVDTDAPRLVVTTGNPVPEGVRVGRMVTSDGVGLRYAIWPKTAGPHLGTICLVQGRGEYIEKYFETIADFRARGFAVATFDWRGQGGSDRLTGRHDLGYVDRFEDYWIDLRCFHAEILLPDCPPPYCLVGHSMGGLASLYAATQDRMLFDRVLLSAPMLVPFGMEESLRLAGFAAEAMSFVGLGRLPIPRRGDGLPTADGFARNTQTSDRGRYLRMVETLAAGPELHVGPPSFRWLAAAARMMGAANGDAFPARIQIPVLMLAAARDRIVSTPAIERLGLRLRTGRHMVVPAAQHELFMETDAVRGQVLAALDAFITNQTR